MFTVMCFDEVFKGSNSHFPMVGVMWEIAGNYYYIYFGLEFQVHGTSEFIRGKSFEDMIGYGFGQNYSCAIAGGTVGEACNDGGII